MNLYKAWNSDIHSEHDIIVMYAENEQVVKDGIANIRSKDDCFTEWLFEDACLDEIIEDLEGNNRVFSSIQDGKQAFANEVYRAIHLKEWTIQEIKDVPENHFVCAVYPADYTGVQENVELIFVPNDCKNTYEFTIDEMALRESKGYIFREHIDDAAINMSFHERFFIIDGEYAYCLFDCYRPANFILEKFNYDVRASHKFIEERRVANIFHFFIEKPEYAELYLDYVDNYTKYEEDIPFDDKFYKYVAKKLIQEGDWNKYTVKEIREGE
ncbi:hypothetical protein [Bacillus weihaiensis]|uniref:hypothetical protein n=1 Tax=Bacillus weihaiensis TaxID=1547283 RepID=UPI002357A0A7|nr:hypothetical protein [Bacillus weihaiensis]